MSASSSLVTDPVCGNTVVVENSPHLVFHSVPYHFCSQQCQERFAESPEFFTAPRKLVDRSPLPKAHRFRFVLVTTETLRTACAHLRQLKGIMDATPGDDSLNVRYDLRFVSLEQIESSIASAGLMFKGGLHALQRKFWRLVEHNELANLATVTSACCNRPPTRLR